MSQGFDFSIAIGGAAGQGIATPGNILARMFVRRGLHLNAYNAYQSIIRGGHILLTMRVREREALSHGDHIHLLLCLNQDTMTRHLRHLGPGAYAVYNADNITPGEHQGRRSSLRHAGDRTHRGRQEQAGAEHPPRWA